MSSLIDMMQQVKSLKNGIGVQKLLDEAYKILGNPIVMFDTGYKLLSHTEVETDDPIWNEIITYGTFSKKTQEFFRDEGFVEDVANAKRITLMSSDKLKYKRFAGKLFNRNNTHVANLVLTESNKPFTADDPMVFEGICKVITKEISNSDFYQEYEIIYEESLVKKLIEGDYADKELYAAHVAIIYDNLKSNLYLAAVDISQCNPDYSKLVYFRNLFKRVQPEYKYAIYSNYILVIISTDNELLNVTEDLSELNKLFEQHNMYAGISSKCENLFELNKHYQYALKALKYIKESNSAQRIFPQDADSISIIEQIRALKNGMGVQYLLNNAYEILDNPVLMHDKELKLLACTENVNVDDPIWEEYFTYGTVSDETIEFFENEGFLDSVANTQMATFLVSNKLRYNRIVGKIFNKDNIMIGCLIIVASNESFGSDAMALFGAFCEKVSQEVGQSEFYNNYGQTFSETLICKLIDGNINDYTLFSYDIINIFDNLKSNLYLAVIDKTQCSAEHNRLGYFRELFKQTHTTNRYALYANYIIIIISSDNAALNVEKELSEINRHFVQNNIYAGISSRFGNVYELQKHYAEAVNALNNVLKNKNQHGNQRIFQYDGVKGALS